jgi:RNA polymerase sigma factor (sigma-70 family)
VLFGDLPPMLDSTVPPAEPADGDADLRAAIQALPRALRMTVLLRYYDDLSYGEIAAALGCSAGTVASRLHRAHAALADRLGAHDVEERA